MPRTELVEHAMDLEHASVSYGCIAIQLAGKSGAPGSVDALMAELRATELRYDDYLARAHRPAAAR
jgi:hypothetical protein